MSIFPKGFLFQLCSPSLVLYRDRDSALDSSPEYVCQLLAKLDGMSPKTQNELTSLHFQFPNLKVNGFFIILNALLVR